MAVIPKMAISNAGEEAEQEVLSLVADRMQIKNKINKEDRGTQDGRQQVLKELYFITINKLQ